MIMKKTNFEIGDMFKIRLAYEDSPEQSKMRPIVIIDIDDDDLFYVKFTSKAPQKCLWDIR